MYEASFAEAFMLPPDRLPSTTLTDVICAMCAAQLNDDGIEIPAHPLEQTEVN
jgi:hypothetical protein